jgi:hypothetical protein
MIHRPTILNECGAHLNSFGSVCLAVDNHYVAVLDLRHREHNIPVSVSAEAISPGESR